MTPKAPKILLLLLVLLAPGYGLYPAPLVSLGDNIAIFFNGSSSVRVVSNVLLDDDDEKSDTIFIFSPGFEISIGQEKSSAQVSLFYREDFWVYADEDNLDNNNSYYAIDARYASPKLELVGTFNYYETDQNTKDINFEGVLIEREITDFGLDTEYTMSQKFSIVGGFDFYKQNFVSADRGFRDRDSYSFPINFYYKYSPKLGIGAGYRYRQTNVDEGSDREDHFFNVGLRGELTPKLDANVRLGTQNREIDEVNDSTTTFAILSQFTWQASDKATVIASFNRDFATGGEGNSIKDTGMDVAVDYEITPLMLGHASFTYSNANYDDIREDDYYNVDVSVRYYPTDYLGLSAGYLYQNNDSNEIGRSFENNILNLTATLRY